MVKVVLISCVKRKVGHAAKAKDLYDSPRFRLSWEYANSLNPEKIFILSAKYHLLDPEKVIEPYDQTLNTMSRERRRAWAKEAFYLI